MNRPADTVYCGGGHDPAWEEAVGTVTYEVDLLEGGGTAELPVCEACAHAYLDVALTHGETFAFPALAGGVMRLVVAVMAAVVLAVGGARLIEVTDADRPGCHLDLWPVPRNECPINVELVP